MATFPVHTLDSAPAAAGEALTQAKAAFGFVPNLLGVLAAAPPAAKAYLVLTELMSATSLSPVEQQLVLLTASHENGCSYCMAAHSTVAAGLRMPEAVLFALRAGTPLPDPKLEALRAFTKTLVDRRGHAAPAEVAAFLEAGYSEQNALEVVLGLTMKTLSNYANNVAGTPVDGAFAKWQWQKKA